MRMFNLDYPIGPCYGLNDCASHFQIHMLNPNVRCDCVEMEVALGSYLGMRSELSELELVP